MALPVHDVALPSVLDGQANGRLPDRLLYTTQSPGADFRLVQVATRALRAMLPAIRADLGTALVPSSLYDSYRPYSVQESTFRARYTTQPQGGGADVYWNGQWWWHIAGATAARPGTSNHGWGITVDFAEWIGGRTVAIRSAAVGWLVAHAADYGWSAELQSEEWHWRYYRGDSVPAKVLAYEKSWDDMTPEQQATGETVARWVRAFSAGSPEFIPRKVIEGKIVDERALPTIGQAIIDRIAMSTVAKLTGGLTVDVDADSVRVAARAGAAEALTTSEIVSSFRAAS